MFWGIRLWPDHGENIPISTCKDTKGEVKNGISKFMAFTTLVDIDHPFARPLDSALEGRGSVESRRQQTTSVVRLYFYL